VATPAYLSPADRWRCDIVRTKLRSISLAVT